MPVSRLAREFAKQKVWHGTPHKLEGRLADRDTFRNWDELELGEGTYFTPDKSYAGDYRYTTPEAQAAAIRQESPGTLVRAEIPADEHLWDFDQDLPNQSMYIQSRVREAIDEDPRWADVFSHDWSPQLGYEEAFETRGGFEDAMERIGIPGGKSFDTNDFQEKVIFSRRNIGELGRNALPLAVGAGAIGALAPGESTLADTPATQNAAERRARYEKRQAEEERESQAEDFLESIRTMPHDAITAPENEWVLGGVDAVRQIPGSDLLMGGVLDALEEYGWSGEVSPLGAGFAALDVLDPTPLTAALLPIKKEVKEKIAKEGYEMAFDEDYFDELGSGEFSLGLADREGSQIGGITGEVYPESREVRIGISELDEDFHGQGLGGAMYDQVADVARRKGFDLTSDRTVSPDAQRMYERFGRQGMDVQVNPRAEPSSMGNLSTINEPVYRVKVGPLEQELEEQADYVLGRRRR